MECILHKPFHLIDVQMSLIPDKMSVIKSGLVCTVAVGCPMSNQISVTASAVVQTNSVYTQEYLCRQILVV